MAYIIVCYIQTFTLSSWYISVCWNHYSHEKINEDPWNVSNLILEIHRKKNRFFFSIENKTWEILVDLKQVNQDMLFKINFYEFVGFFLVIDIRRFNYEKGVTFQEKIIYLRKWIQWCVKLKITYELWIVFAFVNSVHDILQI